MSTLKLLVESPTFDLDYIIEEKNKNENTKLYIQGPFLMAEEKNRNGRIYPMHEMKNEVDRYITEMVNKNRSLGELCHPSSVDINPERACHMITKLWQEGNIFFGKSKILNTPMGNIVKSLVYEGVQLGVSSRALGKLSQTTQGNTVQDFRLICCDVVHDPSVPTAFVDGILEAKEWVIQSDGAIVEAIEHSYDSLEKGISSLPKKDKDEFLRGLIIDFLNEIK